MNRFLLAFSAILVTVATLALAPMSVLGQVASSSRDTNSKSGSSPAHFKGEPKDTAYSLHMLSTTPIYGYDMPKEDNASIDSSRQFKGARPLPDSFYYPGERHLRNIQQLTFAGENAEAYLSPDDKWLSFQAHGTRPGHCDQIFMMDLDGKHVRRISQGVGRTTCSYIMSSGDKVLYASTQGASGLCPVEPDMSKGYVWALYKGYDIYVADTNGNPLGRLTANDSAYDAEATISPKGDKIVFTSTRNGDIDLYSMNLDGSDVTQLTHEEGYDGGAFYSLDGKEIVYRASRPKGEELKEYRDLLKQGLIRPHQLEIFVMNADGSHKRQVTHLKAASFAPYFFADGKRILFASNYLDPKGREFNLFMINKDGSGLEQITHGGAFNSFPMFTRDGKKLVFCSNRNGSHPHNTNIFVADWVE